MVTRSVKFHRQRHDVFQTVSPTWSTKRGERLRKTSFFKKHLRRTLQNTKLRGSITTVGARKLASGTREYSEEGTRNTKGTGGTIKRLARHVVREKEA